jgi:hypothetical protein
MVAMCSAWERSQNIPCQMAPQGQLSALVSSSKLLQNAYEEVSLLRQELLQTRERAERAEQHVHVLTQSMTDACVDMGRVLDAVGDGPLLSPPPVMPVNLRQPAPAFSHPLNMSSQPSQLHHHGSQSQQNHPFYQSYLPTPLTHQRINRAGTSPPESPHSLHRRSHLGLVPNTDNIELNASGPRFHLGHNNCFGGTSLEEDGIHKTMSERAASDGKHCIFSASWYLRPFYSSRVTSILRDAYGAVHAIIFDYKFEITEMWAMWYCRLG